MDIASSVRQVAFRGVRFRLERFETADAENDGDAGLVRAVWSGSGTWSYRSEALLNEDQALPGLWTCRELIGRQNMCLCV